MQSGGDMLGRTAKETFALVNIALGLFPSYAAHPLVRFAAMGLKVGISTDDPGFFADSIGAEAVPGRIRFSGIFCTLDDRAAADGSHDEANHQQNQEDDEEDLGDAGSACCNSAKSQHCRNQGDDKKDDGVMKHGTPLI